MTPLPSLYECFTGQGVPPEHVEAASTAVAVFLEAHMPMFIPWLNVQTAAMRAETAEVVRLAERRGGIG